MKSIKILNLLRYVVMSIFLILIIIKRFHLYEDLEMVKNVWLYDLPSFFVAVYLVIYLIQSRLELKEKEEEIETLKAQLKN